jgi:hypothetical protein
MLLHTIYQEKQDAEENKIVTTVPLVVYKYCFYLLTDDFLSKHATCVAISMQTPLLDHIFLSGQ